MMPAKPPSCAEITQQADAEYHLSEGMTVLYKLSELRRRRKRTFSLWIQQDTPAKWTIGKVTPYKAGVHVILEQVLKNERAKRSEVVEGAKR